MAFTGRELRSTLTEDGTLRLSLEQVDYADPAADEVTVRIEAAPINPSDLGLLLGPHRSTPSARRATRTHRYWRSTCPRGGFRA